MLNNITYFLTAPYTFQKKENVLPEAEDESVTIRFLYCGVCGSDYSKYIGRRGKYPVSLGHEFVAQVVHIGNCVSEFAENDLVVSDLNYRCNECSFCKNQKSHLCIQNEIGRFSNRAFSSYANIHKSYLYKIPAFSFLPIACLVEPLSCVLHACEKLAIPSEFSILINGCGSIGMLFAFYLKKVLHHDKIKILEINEQKNIKVQKNFGISSYKSGDTFDLIIECSNSIEGLHNALQLSQSGKTICIMSHLYGTDTSFVYEYICKKELNSVFPLRNGDSHNMHLAISYLYSFWREEYNNLLGIYNTPMDAFASKMHDNYSKQIVKCY